MEVASEKIGTELELKMGRFHWKELTKTLCKNSREKRAGGGERKFTPTHQWAEGYLELRGVLNSATKPRSSLYKKKGVPSYLMQREP